MRVSYENKAQSRNVLQLQIHPVDVCVYHIFASFYEELIAKRAEYSGEVWTLVLCVDVAFTRDHLNK